MMNRENANMGAAHPQEATNQTQHNHNKFFNKDASLEIDRLTIELDEVKEADQRFKAAVSREYNHVSSEFGAFSHYVSEASSNSYNNIDAFINSFNLLIGELPLSDHKVKLVDKLKSLTYALHMHYRDLDKTSESAHCLMVKYQKRGADDSLVEFEKDNRLKSMKIDQLCSCGEV